MKNWQGHDMTTFAGRWMHYHAVVAPHRSFYSSATLRKYNQDVKELYQANANEAGIGMLTQKQIDDYKSKKAILASCVNPDNGEPILWPSRTSAFLPTNLPMFAGMLMTAPTPANIIFWQWICQTYVAGLNFGNRNATST